MNSKPPSRPRPIPFIVTGAIVGFIVFGVVSLLGPTTDEGYNITYDPGTALGFMSVVGLCVGALVGAVVAALFTYRK